MFHKPIDLSAAANAYGTYVCTQCGAPLFEAAKKFDAGCGFPSFWMHVGEQVKLNPLDTYGRKRIQLLCNKCGQHLGHLFEHKQTPTQLRYCINADAIQFKET
ncbi:MAG TPA: peptide-methionine (R)-S-oxide reductase [Flavisolibacter sp.]|nr:peptide-methionine (R)-S-oxide reductase [Flavisolibacter sp.]